LCALDAIYVSGIDTFFIVDILKWGDMHYQEFPLVARLHYL